LIWCALFGAIGLFLTPGKTATPLIENIGSVVMGSLAGVSFGLAVAVSFDVRTNRTVRGVLAIAISLIVWLVLARPMLLEWLSRPVPDPWTWLGLFICLTLASVLVGVNWHPFPTDQENTLTITPNPQ
jgi:hypothetical protein